MILGTSVSTGNRHAPAHCGSLFTMTLVRLPDPERARRWCAEQRADGRSVGFVPTMGALHEGHLALVRRAVAENDVVCVSIFVNPLQFNDPKDLARYPRDFDADAAQLERVGCEMVFSGTLQQFFPKVKQADQIVTRDPGPCAEGLEGASRPGHFGGVATICERLFRVVGPGRAYFGEKDFQQSLVVKQLARELGFPEIVVCPTVREPSGLAYSSRNVLLTDAERQQATCLSKALFALRRAWHNGKRDAIELRTVMLHELEHGGVQVEYAELRDPHAWTVESPTGPMLRAQALVAARVGKVRLIDNLRLDRDDDVGAQ